jgi:hypothetical protein
MERPTDNARNKAIKHYGNFIRGGERRQTQPARSTVPALHLIAREVIS